MGITYGFQLVGSSAAFARTRHQIDLTKDADAPVLIEGETGTGKEMAARAVHYLGKRRDKPFVPVNCGALTESLMESELFGHERGAFTDAKSSSMGVVQEAGGGTLFLDEIDALSPRAQVLLLRFLQEGTYRRVGGSGERHVDVRVVVASNANLAQLASSSRFRGDLLYRINVLTVNMPPLRERGEDAVELARLFLGRLSHHYDRPGARLSPGSLSYILGYPWPGNVRELENAVHRAFLLSEGAEVEMAPFSDSQPPADSAPKGFRQAKLQAVGEFEKRYLTELLARTKGNLTRAAVIAGQDRSAFGRLVRKHGLRPTQDPGD